MNLIDAIKSGKRFRRRNENFGGGWYFDAEKVGGFYSLTKLDILADDWEIEEKKVEISRSDLFKALRSVRAPVGLSFESCWPADLAKALGLE